MKPGDQDWMSWVEPALVVQDPEAVAWAETADVVVVGYGGAGACAAIEAAQRGASVVVVERFAGGGATRLSGGVYYGGGGTRFQQEAGVDDTVGDMFAYLKLQTQGAVSDATLQRFCEESKPTLDWLAANGVDYSGKLWPTKANYPPKGHYLYFSGNERMQGYREHARPAPRGHRARAEGDPAGMTGFAYFAALDRAARKAGVRVIDHAPVSRLVLDPDGGVLGVEARVMTEASGACARHEALLKQWVPLNPLERSRRRRVQQRLEALEAALGERRLIRARDGVILSTGGFIHNWGMVGASGRIDHRRTVRLGSPGCDGAGIRLGQTAGGAIAKMDRFDHSRGIRPEVFTRGMLLNPAGERFLNEESYSGSMGEEIVDRGYRKVWLICDKAIRDAAVGLSLPGKTAGGFFFLGLPVLLSLAFCTRRSGSIEGLARKLGMDPAKARATLDAYNRAAGGLEPDRFGKDAEAMQVLGRGPFYAIDMSPTNMFAPILAFTLGGLVVDEETGAVEREEGSVIPGLYAAGRTAVGVCSNSYVSGMSIADCVFSGRRAARSCTVDRAHNRRPAA